MSEKSLYHISEEYQLIVDALEENEGELTEELAERLKLNKEELAVKAFNYINFIKNRQAFIVQLDDEILRLSELKKKADQTIEQLKENLKTAVQTFGDIKTGTFSISLRKSEAVEITDAQELPDHYFTIIPESKKPDKKALKEALKNPVTADLISGAKLVTNHNLVIK